MCMWYWGLTHDVDISTNMEENHNDVSAILEENHNTTYAIMESNDSGAIAAMEEEDSITQYHPCCFGNK